MGDKRLRKNEEIIKKTFISKMFLINDEEIMPIKEGLILQFLVWLF